MPAEHCTSAVVPQHNVVSKYFNHHNKSLKRRTCDGSLYNHRHRVHASGHAPHKRRRVESRGEGFDRACNVVRKSHHKGHANNVKQLTHILGLQPTDSQGSLIHSSNSELQEQIQALQHILSLVELPVTPPPSPPCTQSSQWNFQVCDAERDGACEVLASASFSIREDFFGVPFNTLPSKLTLRETVHKCVWRHLKTDLNTTEVRVEFCSTEAGKLLRSALWKTRKSAVFALPNNFELHLVPQSATVTDDEPLIGYVCPHQHTWQLAETHTPSPVPTPFLSSSPVSPSSSSPKALAAALDIDDTLVRLIPAADKDKYPSSRIRTLPMFGENPEWVLALSTHVEHFLAQASQRYYLALYSVGVPEYVIQVAQVLDPERNLFDWGLLEEGLSSARFEHDNGDISPKHFSKLFSFANKAGGVEDWSRCIGVDDSCGAWNPICRDRIIDPQPTVTEGVWDSNLLQALDRLNDVYAKFHNDDCNKLSS